MAQGGSIVRFGHFLVAALWFASIATSPLSSFCQGVRAIDTPIDGPAALAVDNRGHLFVASLYENNVRRIDLQEGTIATVAGNGKECCYNDNLEAVDVSLKSVWAIAVNSQGDIFISEGDRVRKVDGRTGLISTFAGNGESGNTADGLAATSTSFGDIWALAVDAHDDLFVADMSQDKIFKIEALSGRVFRVAGNGKHGFDGDGEIGPNASFHSIRSIAFDKQENLYIADHENCRVRRMDRETKIIQTVVVTEPMQACADEIRHNSILPSPTDLVIDSEGSIFFLESATDVLMKVSTRSRKPSIVAGNAPRGFSGDGGPAFKAALSGPSGLAIDSTGNLFIADIRNNRVRRVDSRTRTIRTIVGNGLPGIIHGEL
jgi:trimeric autotransporter adhesin